jgi:branched-chain amino acid aminotransferase
MLGFKIPFSVEAIEAACQQVLAGNGLTDAYVRPVAWRGSEQLAVGAKLTKIHLAIACWSWPNPYGADRMKGSRLAISDWKRPHPETAPTAAKASCLYTIGTLAKDKAEAEGFDDALLLDWRGRVAEETGANIFFVFNGDLHTPTPDCFLNGITRQTVIAIARRLGMKVVERTIMPEEMKGASEVFLTGTAAEVTPLRQIGDLHFTPGPITEKLLHEYEKLTRMTPEEVERLAPI